MILLRIKELIITNNKIFVNRTFSKNEIRFSNKIKKSTICKKICCKKFLVKSLGTGFRYNISLKDIEILNDELGKTYFLKSKIDDIIAKNLR